MKLIDNFSPKDRANDSLRASELEPNRPHYRGNVERPVSTGTAVARPNILFR
jgi:hypothetical protein